MSCWVGRWGKRKEESAWRRDILGRQINVGAVKNQVRMSDTWGSCGLILSGDATERVKGHMRPIHLWLSYIAFRRSVHSISISISVWPLLPPIQLNSLFHSLSHFSFLISNFIMQISLNLNINYFFVLFSFHC